MFSGIRRAITPSSNRTETSNAPSGRTGARPASPPDVALPPRRSGHPGTVPPSPPRSPHRTALAALGALMRPSRNAAAEAARSAGQAARTERAAEPLPMAQDLARWQQEAVRNLPHMRADYGQHALGAQDVRPSHLETVAQAVTSAAEQHSPTLNIQYVPAADLPQSIGRLPHLQSLSITITECTRLPDSLGQLSNLTSLVLAGNSGITRLPDSICGLDKLTTLKATAMPLEALPPGIGNLRNLTVLHLVGGSYEQLPPGFTRLSALKELQLCSSRTRTDGGRGLQALPADFGALRALEKLDLSSQRSLRTLPDSLTDLPGLRELNLTSCSSLTALPPLLGRLENLRSLTLKRNIELTRLPDSLCDLRNLKTLDLADCNKLQSLPDNLGNLQRLQKLDLSGCTALQTLPASLAQLPARCEILVPYSLRAQLRQLRPPPPRAAAPLGAAGPSTAAGRGARPRPAALAARPERLAHAPRQAVNAAAQVAAWKERLAPFAHEEGANRFGQWMDAVSRHNQGQFSRSETARMDRIVQAASTSVALRTRLNAYAAEQVHLQRNEMTGMTMTHIPPTTYASVGDLHDVYVAHVMGDPRLATPEAAHAMLSEAARDRFGHLEPRQAIRQLAGDKPPPEGRGRFTAAPWPALEAFVKTHDREGRALAERGGEVIEALIDASTEGDIGEYDMTTGVNTVKNANDMLLHDRYLAVAKQLLAPPQAPGRSPPLNVARG